MRYEGLGNGWPLISNTKGPPQRRQRETTSPRGRSVVPRGTPGGGARRPARGDARRAQRAPSPAPAPGAAGANRTRARRARRITAQPLPGAGPAGGKRRPPRLLARPPQPRFPTARRRLGSGAAPRAAKGERPSRRPARPPDAGPRRARAPAPPAPGHLPALAAHRAAAPTFVLAKWPPKMEAENWILVFSAFFAREHKHMTQALAMGVSRKEALNQ